MVRRRSLEVRNYYKLRSKTIAFNELYDDPLDAGESRDIHKSWAPEKDILIVGIRAVYPIVKGAIGYEIDILINRSVSASWYTDYRHYEDGILFKDDYYAEVTGDQIIDEVWFPVIGDTPSGIYVEEGELVFVHCHAANLSAATAKAYPFVEIWYIELEGE